MVGELEASVLEMLSRCVHAAGYESDRAEPLPSCSGL